MQVNYDLLDTYPGGPYKSRGGYIKRTRFAQEEEEEDEENEEGQVLSSGISLSTECFCVSFCLEVKCQSAQATLV